jgi:uncharacterized cupredoxin-like copper-binding protein
VLLALSTSHKIGLGLVALVFIGFALASSFLLPRYRPDYPGNALRWFALTALVLFAGMILAVEFFGREPAEAEHKAETTVATTTGGGGGEAAKKVAVTEKDFKIELRSTSLSPGAYEFDLKNDGPSQHDLVVNGPGVSNAKTPTIGGGSTATLKVTLKAGEYELYCSVPGHKQLGMDVKVKVA